VLDVERSGGKRPEQKMLLFDNGRRRGGRPGRVYATRRELEMAGRLWSFSFARSESGLVSDYDLQLPWSCLVGGV
jgi:hypothetical protein